MIRAGAAMCASIAAFAIPALGGDAQFPPLEAYAAKAYATDPAAKNLAKVNYITQRCGALFLMLSARLKDSTDPKLKMVAAEVDAMWEEFLKYAGIDLGKSNNTTLKQGITDAGELMLQLGKGYTSHVKASGNFNGNWFTDDLVKSDYKFCRGLQADIQASIRAKTK
jgi:hypothetical protein